MSGEVTGVNPKQSIGATKLPLVIVPPELQVYAAIGLAEGEAKYGANNFLVTPVIASIYVEALQRHLLKWLLGEECDPKTGVPHLASVAANIAILIAAKESDTLVDDRPPSRDLASTVEWAEGIIQAVRKMHKDKKPQHYTINDTRK